jgi:pyrroline-5-carboxylate reductase
MSELAPIVLIGAGKMGSALLQGWLNTGVDPKSVLVVEPSPAPAVMALVAQGVSIFDSLAGLPTIDASVIVIAIKPQTINDGLASANSLRQESTVILSIVAGATIAQLEKLFGNGAAIVRSMPNTPASIGKGITVACANATVTGKQRDLCDKLMRSVGQVAWVDAEALLDPVTAVSGSGPAYLFLLMETLAEAGVDAGLDPELANRLARQTIIGASELAQHTGEPAARLRENVTSPGGTTAAALEVLMAEGGLRDLMSRAVLAAKERAEELGE